MGQGESRHGEGGNHRLRGEDFERHRLPHPSVSRPRVEATNLLRDRRVNQGRLRALFAALRHRGGHKPSAREPSGADQQVAV